MVLWCRGYQGSREGLFERWKDKDSKCSSLDQVRDLFESDRLAWFLGMKGGVPGSRAGIESVKGFLVECWDNRCQSLEPGDGQRASD